MYEDVSSIQRIYLPGGVLVDRTNVPSSEPRNILLVGTTENDGVDAGDAILAGRGNTLLADTIMVLRVEPESNQAYVMSINRDIYVPSIRGKINSAVQYGGIGGLINVVKDFLGIEIDDFIIVNFGGFRRVVDELGGVPVYFPYDVRDEGSFFDANAGCHILNGEQALNYVRSRHYEQRIDGKWTPDNSNDYGRVERQRDFLVLALDQAITRGARNPTVLKRLLGSATASGAVVLDTEFTVQQLVDLGQAFAGFNPENLQRTALPGIGSMIGDASVILVDEVLAQPVLDIFKGNGNTLEPRHVRVDVVDTRTKPDPTAKPAALLAGHGFRIRSQSILNDDTKPRTTIQYSSDQRSAALLLGRFLVADPDFQEVTGLGRLTLTIGEDYEGVLLLPKTEQDLAGKFPGLSGSEAPPQQSTSSTVESYAPATDSTATSTQSLPAPTTTSGIYGRPPDGVACR